MQWLLVAAVVAVIAVVFLSRTEHGDDKDLDSRPVAEQSSPTPLTTVPSLDLSSTEPPEPITLPIVDAPASERDMDAGDVSHPSRWVDFQVLASGSPVVGATIEVWRRPTLPLPDQSQAHSIEPALSPGHARSTVYAPADSAGRVPDASGLTTTDGTCRLECPASGQCIFSAFEASTGRSGYLPLPQDTAVPVRVELIPPTHLSGRVIDEQGSKVANAIVRFRPEQPVQLPQVDGERLSRNPPSLVTDGDGRFCVELDGDWWGFVSAESGPRKSEGVLLIGQDDVELTIGPGYAITGFVVGPDGAPDTHALVRVIRPSSMPFGAPLHQVGTRDEPAGSFSLPVEEAGTYAVFADDERQQLTTCAMPRVSVSESQTHVAVTLQLCPMSTIDGRVVDEHGQPVPGLSLSTLVTASRFVSFSRVQTRDEPPLETDQDGRFLFALLQPGIAYSLVAYWRDKSVPGSSHALLARDVPAGTTGLEVVFDRGAHASWKLRGRVVDASSGNPVTDYRLRLDFVPPGSHFYFPANGPPQERLETGEFVIKGLTRSESYRLVVTTSANVNEKFPIEPPASGAEDVRVFELGSAADLRVQVTTEDGRPAAGVEIQVIPDSLVLELVSELAVSLRSDGNGTAIAKGLRAGDYVVQAQSVTDHASALGRVHMEHGVEDSATLKLAQSGDTRVHARVVDPQGRPMTGVAVKLHRVCLPPDVPVATGTTDEKGEVSMFGVTPGLYQVRSSSDDYGDLQCEPGRFPVWGGEVIEVTCRAGF